MFCDIAISNYKESNSRLAIIPGLFDELRRIVHVLFQ